MLKSPVANGESVIIIRGPRDKTASIYPSVAPLESPLRLITISRENIVIQVIYATCISLKVFEIEGNKL